MKIMTLELPTPYFVCKEYHQSASENPNQVLQALSSIEEAKDFIADLFQDDLVSFDEQQLATDKCIETGEYSVFIFNSNSIKHDISLDLDTDNETVIGWTANVSYLDPSDSDTEARLLRKGIFVLSNKRKAQLMIELANHNGYSHVSSGIWIYTSAHMIAAQDNWTEDNKCKRLDFKQASYWLSKGSGLTYEPINNGAELIPYF